MRFDDYPNKYKGVMLTREYAKFVIDNNLYTQEMEQAFKHMKIWTYISYLSIPVIQNK